MASSNGISDPRILTRDVLRAAEDLGLLRAELARVLRLKCNDIGRLTSGRGFLDDASPEGERAKLFLRFFEAVERQCDGDDVAMRHWLRAEQAELGGALFHLLVDEGRLPELVERIETAVSRTT